MVGGGNYIEYQNLQDYCQVWKKIIEDEGEEELEKKNESFQMKKDLEQERSSSRRDPPPSFSNLNAMSSHVVPVFSSFPHIIVWAFYAISELGTGNALLMEQACSLIQSSSLMKWRGWVLWLPQGVELRGRKRVYRRKERRKERGKERGKERVIDTDKERERERKKERKREREIEIESLYLLSDTGFSVLIVAGLCVCAYILFDV